VNRATGEPGLALSQMPKYVSVYPRMYRGPSCENVSAGLGDGVLAGSIVGAWACGAA